MRTPNSKCVVCGKPLYRRPFELARVRHVACMKHRGEAQRREGLTDKQITALALGREKGTNHLAGISKSEESKRKRSATMMQWCADHQHIIARAGAKRSGPNHYRWKGGASKLNIAIRQLTENRKWMDAVKERDGACLKCGGANILESHHIISLQELIESYGIKDREQARTCEALWDLSNGITLCQRHHYKEHGRTHADSRKDLQENAA